MDELKQQFIDHFSRISRLSEDEANGIKDGMCLKRFEKGSVILKQGQLSIDTYFILKGCIREYVESDGEEKTTNFFIEDQWVISLGNFGTPTPVDYNLICVEDTVVSVGNEQSAREMFERFPRFETISRAVMETYFAQQKKKLTSFLTDSPEQRYLNLLKSNPDLFQRIPQYQIASYIGVKPESLSRIRKRVLKS